MSHERGSHGVNNGDITGYVRAQDTVQYMQDRYRGANFQQ